MFVIIIKVNPIRIERYVCSLYKARQFNQYAGRISFGGVGFVVNIPIKASLNKIISSVFGY